MAAQRVAYITRQGAYSPAEARIRHQGLKQGTALEREDLVYWRARNLPTWAHDDPTVFFTAAEHYTSAHQTAYEEWKLSLPRELSRRQQMAAARAFLHEAFGDTHPYVWAMHDPPAADGGRQPHVHVIWSARTLDEHERSPAQFFRRYNRAHPEKGGAEKARAFSHFGSVKAFRTMYTDVMNAHLEQAGHAARLHPDRLSDRGFDREPEPRLHPSDSNALKYRYEVTPRMQEVFDHRHARAQHVDAELADAQRYWHHRKAELGIAREMPLAQRLERIGQARTQRMSQAPERRSLTQLQAQEQALAQSVVGLEGYVQQVERYRQREERIEHRRERREWRDELAAERILVEGKMHGLPTDSQAEKMVATLSRLVASLEQGHDEPQAGAALNVRLYEKGRDQGWGW